MVFSATGAHQILGNSSTKPGADPHPDLRSSRSTKVKSLFRPRHSFLSSRRLRSRSVSVSRTAFKQVEDQPNSPGFPIRSPTPRMLSPAYDESSDVEREVERLKQEVAYTKAAKRHLEELCQNGGAVRAELAEADPFGRDLSHLPAHYKLERSREWSTPSRTVSRKQHKPKSASFSRLSLAFFGIAPKQDVHQRGSSLSIVQAPQKSMDGPSRRAESPTPIQIRSRSLPPQPKSTLERRPLPQPPNTRSEVIHNTPGQSGDGRPMFCKTSDMTTSKSLSVANSHKHRPPPLYGLEPLPSIPHGPSVEQTPELVSDFTLSPVPSPQIASRKSRPRSRRYSREHHVTKRARSPLNFQFQPPRSPKSPRSASAHRQRRFSSQRLAFQQGQGRKKPPTIPLPSIPTTPNSPNTPRTPRTPITPMSPSPSMARLSLSARERRRKRMMKLVKTLGDEVPISLIGGDVGSSETDGPSLLTPVTRSEPAASTGNRIINTSRNTNSPMPYESLSHSSQRVFGSRPLPQPPTYSKSKSDPPALPSPETSPPPMLWNNSDSKTASLAKKRSFLRKKKDTSDVVLSPEPLPEGRLPSPGSASRSVVAKETGGGGMKRKMSLSRLFSDRGDQSSSPLSPSTKTKLIHSRNLPVPPLPSQTSWPTGRRPDTEALPISTLMGSTSSRPSTSIPQEQPPQSHPEPRTPSTNPNFRRARSLSQSRNLPVSLTVVPPPVPRQLDIQIIGDEDSGDNRTPDLRPLGKENRPSRIPGFIVKRPVLSPASSSSANSWSDVSGKGSWQDLSGGGSALSSRPSMQAQRDDSPADVRRELRNLTSDFNLSPDSSGSRRPSSTRRGVPFPDNTVKRVGSLGLHVRSRSKSLITSRSSPGNGMVSPPVFDDYKPQSSPSLSRSRTLSAPRPTQKAKFDPEAVLPSPGSIASWMSFAPTTTTPSLRSPGSGPTLSGSYSPSLSSPIFGHANPRSLEWRERTSAIPTSAKDQSAQQVDQTWPPHVVDGSRMEEQSRKSSEQPRSESQSAPNSASTVGSSSKRNRRVSGPRPHVPPLPSNRGSSQGLIGKGSIKRKETRQGWSGEWNQTDIRDVIHKLRNIK